METVVLNISIIRARTALVTHTGDSSDIVVIDVKVSEGMPLSANLTETPAPLGITVGRWR